MSMGKNEGVTPASELLARIAKFQQALQEKGLSGALIIQKTDLFYFASTSQQGWLYIPDKGEALLMVFKEYGRAKIESNLAQIVSLVSPKKIPDMLATYGYVYPSRLGMELDVLPANLFFQYQNIFQDATIIDVSYEIRLTRAVKSRYELSFMRQAAAFSDQVCSKVPEFLEEGQTEIAIAGRVEGYARSLGHQGIVRMRLWGSELFYGHLMSGASAAVPSYLSSPTGGGGISPSVGQGASFNKVARHEPILLDYVFAWQGYISDHTRIFSIGGLPDELLQAHEAMLQIQEAMRRQALPGALSGELYEIMTAMAADKGYEKYFMGTGERKIRFTGHGVGLELDEFPFIAKGQKLILEEGMVIAFEPKVILPGKGVVGIENTHVVTDSGLERLGHSDDKITFVNS